MQPHLPPKLHKNLGNAQQLLPTMPEKSYISLIDNRMEHFRVSAAYYIEYWPHNYIA